MTLAVCPLSSLVSLIPYGLPNRDNVNMTTQIWSPLYKLIPVLLIRQPKQTDQSNQVRLLSNINARQLLFTGNYYSLVSFFGFVIQRFRECNLFFLPAGTTYLELSVAIYNKCLSSIPMISNYLIVRWAIKTGSSSPSPLPHFFLTTLGEMSSSSFLNKRSSNIAVHIVKAFGCFGWLRRC